MAMQGGIRMGENRKDKKTAESPYLNYIPLRIISFSVQSLFRIGMANLSASSFGMV
jgi:hypothetical protein